MPHTVHLRLSAEDFRQHPAMATEPRHWLLDSVYGRRMLKSRLRIDRPDFKVVTLLWQRRLDPQLRVLIELLDLYDWPKPRTLKERLKASWLHLHMTARIREGQPLPSWRDYFESDDAATATMDSASDGTLIITSSLAGGEK
jgi:hypothetical protein